MKTLRKETLTAALLIFIAGFSPAVDMESVETYQLIDRLLSFEGPQAPVIFDDLVIFTASSSHRRVGVSFVDENFSRVHWFRQLLLPMNPMDITGGRNASPYRDSGIVFYLHRIPEGATKLEYRIIIDGLWTTDPANPNTHWDRTSGLTWSVLSLPQREIVPHPLRGQPDGLSFTFRGPPGETITVAGCFNGWDPFMYELREGPPGNYSITISLPPGTYQYIFFHRGQRFFDPFNHNRVYARDGKAANEIIIR